MASVSVETFLLFVFTINSVIMMKYFRGGLKLNVLYCFENFNYKMLLTLFRLGGGGRLTPPRIKSFITHELLPLQCSYFVTFPQIYLGTI